MSEPITDAEKLARAAYDASRAFSGLGSCTDEHWGWINRWSVDHHKAMAVAVAQAICPPGTHGVVPRALIEALTAWATVRASAAGDWMDNPAGDYWVMLSKTDDDLYAAIRAALATEPAPGKEELPPMKPYVDIPDDEAKWQVPDSFNRPVELPAGMRLVPKAEHDALIAAARELIRDVDTVEAENRERYGKGPWMTVPYSRIRDYVEQLRAALSTEGTDA